MEILLRKSLSGSSRKWYHNNGQIEITGQYANGDKTDQWNWYGKNGKLLKKVGILAEKNGKWRVYRIETEQLKSI